MVLNRDTLPQAVSRDEWLEARKEFLAREKELTRARDALNADRRRLPMVRIDKEYSLEGPEGGVSLLELFEGRPQLIVYHFMFDPSWERGCRSCSAGVDEISRGLLRHLNERGTTYAVVSRAPLAKILPFKEQMGWTFPWYSSYGSDFNYDFNVTLDASVAPVMYNFRTHEGQPESAPAASGATEPKVEKSEEAPGTSVFLRVEDEVFHTYSAYARGLEQTGGSPYFLDMTPLGRQEEWEEPKGRLTGLGAAAGSDRIRYPDEYDD